MTFPSRRAAMPLLLCLMAVASFTLRAQDDVVAPPVLLVKSEFLKPGRAGIHEKTEAAYVAAAKAGKATFHYIAMTSMDGPDRALFISGFPSFAAAFEAEGKMGYKNPSLGAALDRALVADGDLLVSTGTSQWMHRPELSLHEEGSLVGVRYIETQEVFVKPGRQQEVDAWFKMYAAAYKDVPSANWSAFQQTYGPNLNTFLFITRMKSLSETDTEWVVQYKAFKSKEGAAELKKIQELEHEFTDIEWTNLYRISPEMSLPSEELVKAEPNFWSPTPVSVAKKPAPATASKP
jgi:hypothetical protein